MSLGGKSKDVICTPCIIRSRSIILFEYVPTIQENEICGDVAWRCWEGESANIKVCILERCQIPRNIWSLRIALWVADLGCNAQPRDEDDKDFIVAFPAEQEHQYDNLGGARSVMGQFDTADNLTPRTI